MRWLYKKRNESSKLSLYHEDSLLSFLLSLSLLWFLLGRLNHDPNALRNGSTLGTQVKDLFATPLGIASLIDGNRRERPKLSTT